MKDLNIFEKLGAVGLAIVSNIFGIGIFVLVMWLIF
jgi:hypothetical protein